MDKHRVMKCAALFVIFMLSASCLIALLVPSDEAEGNSIVRTEEKLTGDSFSISGLTFTSNLWSKVVSAGQNFTFDVILGGGSTFNYADLNISWVLETDWNVTVTYEGKKLDWIYYYETVRWMNMTMTEKANESNSIKVPVKVTVIADMDGDGLSDLWERKYFGSTSRTDGTGDYDGDGWTDMEEFINETDPTIINQKPGFLETYSWLIVIIAVIVVVVVLLIFVIMPKMKTQRQEDEKKKIAAAVEVEKSLLGLDELEDKPKK